MKRISGAAAEEIQPFNPSLVIKVCAFLRYVVQQRTSGACRSIPCADHHTSPQQR
jgi:hypothetical protein